MNALCESSSDLHLPFLAPSEWLFLVTHPRMQVSNHSENLLFQVCCVFGCSLFSSKGAPKHTQKRTTPRNRRFWERLVTCVFGCVAFSVMFRRLPNLLRTEKTGQGQVRAKDAQLERLEESWTSHKKMINQENHGHRLLLSTEGHEKAVQKTSGGRAREEAGIQEVHTLP